MASYPLVLLNPTPITSRDNTGQWHYSAEWTGPRQIIQGLSVGDEIPLFVIVGPDKWTARGVVAEIVGTDAPDWFIRFDLLDLEPLDNGGR